MVVSVLGGTAYWYSIVCPIPFSIWWYSKPLMEMRVGRYDGSSVDTLTAIKVVQASIESAATAPEYSLSDEEFRRLQEEMFGPRLPGSQAPSEDNVETMPVLGCDLDAATLAEQDYIEQVNRPIFACNYVCIYVCIYVSIHLYPCM